MLFNINENVKVKLTDVGVEILKKQHEEFKRRMTEADPNANIKDFDLNDYLDEDGYFVTSMYTLMEQFGEYMNTSSNLPFKSNIEIIN